MSLPPEPSDKYDMELAPRAEQHDLKQSMCWGAELASGMFLGWGLDQMVAMFLGGEGTLGLEPPVHVDQEGTLLVHRTIPLHIHGLPDLL